MRAILVVTGLAAVVVASVAAPASAQPVSLGHGLVPIDADTGPSRLTVFMSADAGVTAYDATFLGDRQSNANNTISLLQYTLKKRQQRLLSGGGLFGMRFPLGERLWLHGAIGVSSLSLEDKAGGVQFNTTADGDIAKFYAKEVDLSPGFATNFGLGWEFLRHTRFSLFTGVQFTYFSTFSAEGGSITTEKKVDAGTDNTANAKQLDRSEVTDMFLRFIQVQPHIGVQWRPLRVFAVNSFGMFSNVVVSAASLTQSTVQAGFTSDSVVNLSLAPASYLGAYYGWYVGLARFGTVGIEAQYGTRTSVGVNYQYMF